VYSAVFTKKTIGLQLAPTQHGLRVTGFANTFDMKEGKDVELDDYLVAINELTVRGNDLSVLQRVLALTSPPR
jgi:hypothetical protein